MKDSVLTWGDLALRLKGRFCKAGEREVSRGRFVNEQIKSNIGRIIDREGKYQSLFIKIYCCHKLFINMNVHRIKNEDIYVLKINIATESLHES